MRDKFSGVRAAVHAGRPRIMKQVNEALVREALIGRGRAAVTDLAFDTGLSLTAVSRIINAAEARGEVKRNGLSESSGGRRAAVYELDPQASRVLSVAIEVDTLDWAVANALGTVVSEGRRCVREDPFAETVELVRAMRNDICSTIPSREALAVGVPGAVQDGRILTGRFRDRWGDADVASFFREATGLPTVVENDVNAAALGFARRAEDDGAALQSLMFIFFNDGCTGSGIVYDGRVLRGARRFAGELGFLPMRGGAVMDELLAEAESDAEYVATICDALAAVNCIVNPALFVIGGTTFRFDLSDALRLRFNAGIHADVRPKLVFERDSRTPYLYGLCGLAAGAAHPAYRLID